MSTRMPYQTWNLYRGNRQGLQNPFCRVHKFSRNVDPWTLCISDSRRSSSRWGRDLRSRRHRPPRRRTRTIFEASPNQWCWIPSAALSARSSCLLRSLPDRFCECNNNSTFRSKKVGDPPLLTSSRDSRNFLMIIVLCIISRFHQFCSFQESGSFSIICMQTMALWILVLSHVKPWFAWILWKKYPTLKKQNWLNCVIML